MSITLQQAPARLAFSQNPNVIKLFSDDYRSIIGVQANNVLIFTGPVAAGAVINLTWAGRTYTFTAAAAPDSSGFQIPAGAGDAAYVSSLVPVFNSNRYIRRDFTITYELWGGLPAVIFNARVAGIRFNMDSFNGPISLVRPYNGRDEEIKPNFTQYVEVHLVDGGLIYNRPLNLDYPFTGITTKDVSDILHAYLDYDIPVLNSVWQPCTKSVKDYFILYSQLYGEIPEYRKMYQSGIKTVCLGGYSNMALSRIENANHFEKYLLPDPALIEYQRWFETYPTFDDVNPLTVRTNQPQFLYFMNCRDVAESLKIRVEAFSNGQNRVIDLPGGVLQSMAKACIACGYMQLGLQNLDVEPDSYTIQILSNATSAPRSVKKKFAVNRQYEEYTRYILYSDSSGNFKTIHCHGRSVLTGAISSSLAERFEGIDTPNKGNFIRHDVRITESDELNTGYLLGDQSLDALQELMLAKYAFRVIGNTLIPIIITGTKFTYEADGQNLNALKIEYRLAYDEKLYTGSAGSLIVPRLNTSQNAINDL